MERIKVELCAKQRFRLKARFILRLCSTCGVVAFLRPTLRSENTYIEGSV